MADAGPDGSELLSADAIRLGCTAVGRFEVVPPVGALPLEIGAVQPAYAEAMQERERSLSSFVGEGFAIPHGTDESRQFVDRAAVAFLQYPDGIDWDDDEEVYACVAIAAASDEHVTVMAQLARVLVEPDQAAELRTTTDPERILAILAPEEPAEESADEASDPAPEPTA
jgi:mannitol/fructose-specific phosphotransferase system IIA component